MNPQIRSTADTYRFNTVSVRVALADLSPEQAGLRWREGEGSSIAFLAGHLLSSRCGLLKRFGVRDENPWATHFGTGAEPKDASEYPPVAELAEGWEETATVLERILDELDDDALEQAAEGFPVDDKTARGALMFMAWHESYHLGQIGLMRTEMGLPSVQARLYDAFSAAPSG